MNLLSSERSLASYLIPLRLGYQIAELGATYSDWPAIPYRGLDRHPILFPLGADIEAHVRQDSETWRLVQRFDSADRGTMLHTDRAVAEDMGKEMSAVGIHVEVIYAELIDLPQDQETPPNREDRQEWLDRIYRLYRPIHDQLGSRPDHLTLLGYDLATPLPTFYSSLRQPGIKKVIPDLPDFLNEFGLITELLQAEQFLPVVSRAIQSELICIVGVWTSAKLRERSQDFDALIRSACI